MSLQDINKLKKRFMTLNRDRLLRTRDDLRPRQQDVLDMLPLLFHSNHPAFPGYVSKTTPVGISDYSPSQKTLDAGKRLVRSFEHKRRALLQFDIYSIFLMGSSGTIAYTSKSDFDIWLCHRPDLNTIQLAELQQKTTLIEQWADSMDLEVHFFLMNADTFRHGQDTALSVESSGSAQHHLLLEEFYRTGLLLAGRYPVWWLVPHDKEINYNAYIKHLKIRRFIKENETIDFGGLPQAPAEEFFGAALWQLYKGIDSPYKAALKLMLMEVYADEYPNVDLLSQRFKKEIHAGETGLAKLDPYIMLYKKLEEYLLKNDENKTRLELVRRCFYFKVNESLSTTPSPRQENWRHEIMAEFSREWRWNEEYIELLDSRPSWKIDRVVKERMSLVQLLTQSYHLLSNFARQHALSTTINQHDLTILGRKLYAAFERKSGKIDIVNRGISDNVWESQLTISQVGKDKTAGWALHRGINSTSLHRSTAPLKRTPSLIEMISWCHLNKIVNEHTAFSLHTHDNAINVSEIKALIKCFQQLFPEEQSNDSSMGDFSQSTQLSKSALFINVGTKLETDAVKEGKFLTSNKIDAFSYGGICQNLVYSIDHVVLTSWHEVMTFRYEGEQGIFEYISAYLKWSPPSLGKPPAPISTFCFSTNSRGTTISRRINELLNDIIDCFYHGKHSRTARYVLMIEHKYYVLSLDNDKLQYTIASSYRELLQQLEKPLIEFSPVIIDRYADANNFLTVILNSNKPGVIQIYIHMDGANADIYIVDECGSLFFQHRTQVNLLLVINQNSWFLESVIRRQYIHASPAEQDKDSVKLEFYEAIKSSSGKLQLVNCQDREQTPTDRFFNLQVIGNIAEAGQLTFTIFCDETEFSSLEFGEDLFRAVAAHVLEKRKGGSCYPIYITDIDIPHNILDTESQSRIQTILYLKYKRFIEDKMNAALASLVEAYQAKAS